MSEIFQAGGTNHAKKNTKNIAISLRWLDSQSLSRVKIVLRWYPPLSQVRRHFFVDAEYHALSNLKACFSVILISPSKPKDTL
jgi:hypothetical protein